MVGRSNPKKLDAEELWNYALRVLSQRPYSATELRTKLSRRSVSPQALGEVLNKLQEYGFANDQKFSEAFASARLNNQGFGRLRVLRELRAKRVPKEIAERAVKKTFADTNELELVDQFLARKYRGKDLSALFQDEKNLASAYRRLRLAGFTNSVTLSVLRRYKQDVPDSLETEEEGEA